MVEKPTREPRNSFQNRTIDGLEPRLVMSAAATLPGVVVDSAKTADSKSVTFDYDITSNTLPSQLTFGIYRSADAAYDAGDTQIASITLNPNALGQSTADSSGQPATAIGQHELTVQIPGALPLIPDQPFVLVVAQPSTAIGAADQAARTADIHIHIIGVVTHGGIQTGIPKSQPPLWERQMASSLQQQGYDAVIPYNWVGESTHPGEAAKQAPQLARMINKVAASFPSGDPVDIHFIGHSEGAIVNSQADQLLEIKEASQIKMGYIEMTMLDPHAARSHAPSGQYSVGKGWLNSFARDAINWYQYFAHDPIAAVPPNVNSAQVFFQHTRVQATYGSNDGSYNLWGQVPVRGHATYYDLTGPGISHAGDFSVHSWYEINVVPTLHDGGNFVDPDTLTGHHVLDPGEISVRRLSTSKTSTPEFQGTATPDAGITLFAARSGSLGWKVVSQTTSDDQGNWTAAPAPMLDGRYRFVVRSSVEADPGHPDVRVTPRLRLGAINIDATRQQKAQAQKQLFSQVV